MNISKQFTNNALAGGIYQRCLWAFAIAGIMIIFFFISWLSIQRAEILIARRHTQEAEARISAVQGERDAAMRERFEGLSELNKRLSKSEELRIVAEKKLAEMPSLTAGLSKASETQTSASQNVSALRQPGRPAVEALTAFIKEHLSHMTETSVNAQLTDYAEDVDFHDKPHATLAVIENERKRTAQRYPSRTIFKDGVQPQFTAVLDARYQWIVTATFDYRWIYRSRSGGHAQGVTRDIWKIVPEGQTFKIIAEHSYEPATGRSKD